MSEEVSYTGVQRVQTVYCDFCAKTQHEVDQLIAGPKAHICNECVELAADVFADKRNAAKAHLADIRENGT